MKRCGDRHPRRGSPGVPSDVPPGTKIRAEASRDLLELGAARSRQTVEVGELGVGHGVVGSEKGRHVPFAVEDDVVDELLGLGLPERAQRVVVARVHLGVLDQRVHPAEAEPLGVEVGDRLSRALGRTNDALLADPWPTQPEAIAVAPDAGAQLLGAIADGLGLPASQVRPAYEDPLARLINSVRRPAGEPVAVEDDLEADAADRRAALLFGLDQSVTEAAAHVLPLHRRDDDSGWASADWKLRRGRIVLLEGDSPAGLRLPLNSISWHPPSPRYNADPLTRHGGLPVETEAEAAVVEDADSAPTTAMVAEIRDGLLYIYMPPSEELEHFVDLISRVEVAAAKVDCATPPSECSSWRF